MRLEVTFGFASRFIFSLGLILFLFANEIKGQQALATDSKTDPHLECISRLRLPIYGPIAESSRGGTVVARIRLAGGKALTVDLTATDPKLKGEVKIAINDSEFSTRCEGVDVLLRFRFRDAGESPNTIRTWKTYFVPPNGFEIVGTHPPTALDSGSPLK
ncbi:MAG TPA: hypothetical protein VJN43_15105 [Bryobacteraceae bacterium]|nr:hypothetical protein [Bryobacteraceae bacterium]